MTTATAPNGDGAAASEDEAADAAVAAVETLAKQDRGRVTLSTGVVLKLAPVPILAIREAGLQIKRPEVPVVMMADKGREEANPNDPDYLQAMSEYTSKQIIAVANVLLLLGTSVETLPDGILPPESDEWSEPLLALDIHIDTSNKYKRYLSWLRMYACRSHEDIQLLMTSSMRLTGVTEVDVAQAIAAFRSNTSR